MLHKAIFDYLPGDAGLNVMYGDKELIKEALVDPDVEKDIPWVEAISIDYGQRHRKELEYAAKTCKALGIKQTILDVGAILSGKQVMLTDKDVKVPNIDYADIKGVSPTYVPFRNGTLLSVITAHAQKYVNEQIQEMAGDIVMDNEAEPGGTAYLDNGGNGIQEATAAAKDIAGVYFGAHSEDAQNWAYPDCTPEFIGAMANAIYVGTYFCIRLHTPLQWLMKHEIVTLGDSLNVNFANTWSCYKGEEKHCGVCPTCRSRKQAFEAAGVRDPTEYQS